MKNRPLFFFKRRFQRGLSSEGGILKYLEETLLNKACGKVRMFRFDGKYCSHSCGVEKICNINCHACGWPLLPAEAEEASYEHGVSCKYCIDNTTEKQKKASVCASRRLLRLNVNAFKIILII